jgi:hypothetical protein
LVKKTVAICGKRFQSANPSSANPLIYLYSVHPKQLI